MVRFALLLFSSLLLAACGRGGALQRAEAGEGLDSLGVQVALALSVVDSEGFDPEPSTFEVLEQLRRAERVRAGRSADSRDVERVEAAFRDLERGLGEAGLAAGERPGTVGRDSLRLQMLVESPAPKVRYVALLRSDGTPVRVSGPAPAVELGEERVVGKVRVRDATATFPDGKSLEGRWCVAPVATPGALGATEVAVFVVP